MTTPQPPQFPAHTQPRTWLLTSGASPIAIALARALLAHGDAVVLGVLPEDREETYHNGEPNYRAEDFGNFMRDEVEGQEQWNKRCRTVELDGRIVGQCQAAVAETVEVFGKIDVVFCCTSEAVIGTVEELGVSERMQMLVREQFETNVFGPINIIKASLPAMRERKSGHIIALTGITSHLGTPGMGIYCASGWALEGFCDSIAYEIAPFNIKVTIVQPNLEINVLTNRITAAPVMPSYSPVNHPAPLARTIIGGLLDRIEDSKYPSSETTSQDSPAIDSETGSPQRALPRALSSEETISVVNHNLPPEMQSALLDETIHALTAIGGHENPPARHIVGFEGVMSVKEKLKTVSEELEDFVEVSAAVDIDEKAAVVEMDSGS